MARLLTSLSNVLAEDNVRESSKVMRKEKDRPFIVARLWDPVIGKLIRRALSYEKADSGISPAFYHDEPVDISLPQT